MGWSECCEESGRESGCLTVIFFPATCMTTCTSSAVKFRLRSFLITVMGSTFCFILFLHPGAALTMVIDPGGVFPISEVARSVSAVILARSASKVARSVPKVVRSASEEGSAESEES